MLNFKVLTSYLNRNRLDLKVVSFDIFDTLLIRLLSPERVMQVAAQKLSELLDQPHLASPFFKSRLEYKKKMDDLYPYGEAEWTVSQWLEALPEELGINFKNLTEIGRQAELEAEQLSLRLADDAGEALSFVKRQGLRTIAISDMWLDTRWLKDLLYSFGLCFDYVFSSGTLKASKRRGTIFPLVEKELDSDSKAFLHVGDNLKADWLRPRLAGWRSIWMPMDSKL